MKVSIIGTVGLPACYGGWETLVDNIVKSRTANIEYSVYCSSKNYKSKIDSYNGAHLIYLPISANGISSIFYDIISLVHTWFTRPNVVLILGVSGCVFLPFYKLFSRSKIVINVDGIEWKRDKWSGLAKWFLKYSESVAVRYSDIVIADNDGISDYISETYDVRSKVIAYGGEHSLVSELTEVTSDYFFTVCRIEPENNVRMILMSFSQSGLKYKIVGNWKSSQYGIDLKTEFLPFSNIEMIDPIYDLNQLFEYRDRCIGYIHGHSVGGTNPSLVEIMHFSKQVYAYDCVFNRYTTENRALYFSNSDEISRLLLDANVTVENHDLKSVAMKRYTWNIVTKQYEELYGI
jgi:glycosyltransferase involved in cell wall biosynthesis